MMEILIYMFVSGGNEDNFGDKIYWNDGKGNFTVRPGSLPLTNSSGGTVIVFDFDHDGDLDIFRGGQVLTGSYPLAPESYLFKNDNGIFNDVTPAFLKHIGMVNSAAVGDLNKDGVTDLVLAGEYMPVTILWAQKESPFFSKEKIYQIPNSTGWWNCIKIDDMDNDGNPDIIAGNHGLNSQMKPTVEQPVTIDAGDIDNNGSVDAIISYYIDGKSYPLPTRDELIDQVPSIKGKFSSYKAYCDATVKDIFTRQQFDSATHLKAEEFRSGIFFNKAGDFHFEAFSNEAQAFPVRDFLINDFNHDGLNDLLLTGNDFAVRAQSGRYDAGKGLLLSQTKNHSFIPVRNNGFLSDKDARKIKKIDNFIIVANNNDKMQVFSIN